MTTPLFLVPVDGDGPFAVTIDLPQGWHVGTSWSPAPDRRSHLVGSIPQLNETALVISRHEAAEVRVGHARFRIAALGEFQGAEAIITPVVRAQVQAALSLLPDTGPLDHLLVFFPDRWDTGEALEGSNVMSSGQGPALETVALWGKTIAHELVHHWNGHTAYATDWAASQWFSEGSTDYLASLVQLRAGTIDEESFLGQMRKHLHLYLLFDMGSVHEDIALVDAGQNKAANNAAIYDGGALAAFCFDGLIRTATKGEHTLADVVAALAVQERGDGYTNEEVISTIARFAGADARGLYERSVAGRERLPLVECFSRFGYELAYNALDVHLSVDSRASSQAQLMRLGLRSPWPVSW